MMRIIVSDTSCMIHLEKAALLNAVLALPYAFVMPDALFEDEWLGLSESDKKTLCDSGLRGTRATGSSRNPSSGAFQPAQTPYAQRLLRARVGARH